MSTVQDWLRLHDLPAPALREILKTWRTCVSPATPQSACSFRSEPCAQTALAMWVTPAIAVTLGQAFADAVEQLDLQPAHGRPRTVDRGSGTSPSVHVDYDGSAGALLWLIHEVGHGLHILASEHRFMPPIARETCAFLVEDIVIAHLGPSGPGPALAQVRDDRRAAYLAQGVGDVLSALWQPQRTYDYDLNYPPACAYAQSIGQDAGKTRQLLAAGAPAMALLHDWCPPRNPLPAVQDVPQDPVRRAYRRLGMMVMLDLEIWDSHAQQSVETYYGNARDILHDNRLGFALRPCGRPDGYVVAPPDGTESPIRRAAAFRPAARLLPLDTEATVAPSPQKLDLYEVIGYAVELLAASPYHRQQPIGPYIEVEVLPPTAAGQLRIWRDPHGIPAAMASWALLSETVEQDVLGTGRALAAADWQSGERLFFNDWITPHGHLREVLRDVRALFPNRDATSLRRHADTSVRRVNRWVNTNHHTAA